MGVFMLVACCLLLLAMVRTLFLPGHPKFVFGFVLSWGALSHAIKPVVNSDIKVSLIKSVSACNKVTQSATC